MTSILNSIFRSQANLLEAGLITMTAAMESVQRSLEAVAGVAPASDLKRPPIEGPNHLDTAITEFANRAMRILRQTPLDPAEAPDATRALLRAFQSSFRYLDPKDPRSLLLPLQLPLSTGALLADGGLRALTCFRIVGPRRFPAFLSNLVEMFSDLPVYVGVYYRELIDTYRQRLERLPGDAATRTELGRVYVKCGLYSDAIRELTEAAKNPSVRAVALHEAAVAHFRSCQYGQAVQSASEALSADPANERTRAWLWLSAQKLGGYPDAVPAEQRMEVIVGHHPATVEYEDIAARIGVDKTSAGRGAAVIDLNNDGRLDIVIAAASAGCSVYRNNGDGTFTDISVGSGLDSCVNGFIIAAGDYNNDGYPDLFVTRLGFYSGEGNLYRNNGDGTFTDVTVEAGLECWGPAFTASWVDYDCDGHLDLFVANNLGGVFDRKVPNRLFRNNGNGTFTEVAAQAGLLTSAPTIGSAWGDYNNDGYPDLFLSNAIGRPQLFRNNGDGTFTDVSREAGLEEMCFGSVCLWWDYDNDGWLDVVQFTWSDHENVIYTMRHGQAPPDGHPAQVYRNNRDGTFTLVSRQIGIDGCWGTMSGNGGDLNNDGWLDLVLGNGSPRMDRTEPLVLMENDGAGMFRNTTFSAGLPITGKSHGTNLADLFGDGRLSILVASGGAYPGDTLTTSVFCPKKLPGNYLNVRLTGTRSNRDALGARITMEAGGRKQYREVSGGSNFGCLPFEQHFGLRDLESVSAIDIRWPSGLRQRLEHLPVNTTIRITEGADRWEPVYQERKQSKAKPGRKTERGVTMPPVAARG